MSIPHSECDCGFSYRAQRTFLRGRLRFMCSCWLALLSALAGESTLVNTHGAFGFDATDDGLHEHHDQRLEKLKELQNTAREAQSAIDRLKDFQPEGTKPYSFLSLEALQESLELEELNSKDLETEIASAERLVETSSSELVKSEKALQVSKGRKSSLDMDALEKASDDVATARAKLELMRIEQDILKIRLEIGSSRRKQIEHKIEIIEKDVRFTSQDRDKKLDEIQAKETEWRVDRSTIESQLEMMRSFPLSAEIEKNEDAKIEVKRMEPWVSTSILIHVRTNWNVIAHRVLKQSDKSVLIYSAFRSAWKSRSQL